MHVQYGFTREVSEPLKHRVVFSWENHIQFLFANTYGETADKRSFNLGRAFMKRLISTSLTIFITFCLLVATDRRAWGYVDPGSGLIALQTFASVGAAYAYVIRRRIRTFFSRKEETTCDARSSTVETCDPSKAS